MNRLEERDLPPPSGGSLYDHWSEVCYIPHNDAFGIAMSSMAAGKPYDREVMRAAQEERKQSALAQADTLLTTVTHEDHLKMKQVFDWIHTSLAVLLDHVAQLGSVGDLPVIEGAQGKKLDEYAASDLGQLAIRISQLPGTPFMGWKTPALRARFSEHHEQGIVIDIVPEDPRFGGSIPDWGKPDTAERFPKAQ